jgi:hypothetical protein
MPATWIPRTLNCCFRPEKTERPFHHLNRPDFEWKNTGFHSRTHTSSMSTYGYGYPWSKFVTSGPTFPGTQLPPSTHGPEGTVEGASVAGSKLFVQAEAFVSQPQSATGVTDGMDAQDHSSILNGHPFVCTNFHSDHRLFFETHNLFRKTV